MSVARPRGPVVMEDSSKHCLARASGRSFDTMLARVAPVALFVLFVTACAATQEQPDNTGWETRDGLRGLGVDELGEVETSEARTVKPSLDSGWTGVRHDLALNPAKKQAAVCSCLAVGVGTPNDATFVWRGPRPAIEGDKQAVAISAAGLDCPGAPAQEARRPSIAAIEHQGADVVIEIEEVPSDRPLATGAILAPIPPNGHLYVRQRNAKLPYAKPNGRDLCRVR